MKVLCFDIRYIGFNGKHVRKTYINKKVLRDILISHGIIEGIKYVRLCNYSNLHDSKLYVEQFAIDNNFRIKYR